MELTLAELDSLELINIVDNELDVISATNNSAVTSEPSFKSVSLSTMPEPMGEASKMLNMNNICCGAHGLSLMLVATKGNTKHTLLFDAGPEGDIWERNATRMRLDVSSIEHIHLSHWHRDHSGGMVNAIRMIKAANGAGKGVVADLHPDRPEMRGMMPPGSDPVPWESDPTFSEFSDAGAEVSKNENSHTVLEDMFLISGEIPRKTSYENGLPAGIAWNGSKRAWEKDTVIKDERFVMCNLKGKGLVVITGCGHAGVVNTVLEAKRLVPESSLHCVVGGFHLADANAEKLKSTIQDLKSLRPQIMMPGHCTGWRAKFMIEQELPGTLVPLSVGRRYVL